MSVNIGNDAIEAIKEMRGNNMDRMVAGIGQRVQIMMLNAMKSAPDDRVDQTAYARGMYDLWVALEAAANDVHPNQIKPRAPMSARQREALGV